MDEQNLNPLQSQSWPAPTPVVPQKNKTRLIILICVLFILLAGGAAAYFYNGFFGLLKPLSPLPSASQSTSPIPSFSESPSLSPSPSLLPGQVSVQWYDELIQDTTKKPKEFETADFYKVGKILNGVHEGQILYLKAMEGMGYSFSHVVFAGAQEQEISNIKGIDDAPEQINIPGSEYKLKKGNIGNLFKDDQITKRLFTDPISGDVYQNTMGCMVIQLPDKTALGYNIGMPFVDSAGKLGIKFNNGQINTEEYTYTVPACFSECLKLAIIPANEIDESNLVAGGRAENGDIFYQLKDSNEAALKEIYNDKNTAAYFDNVRNLEKNKYTYQQFLDYNPLFYWKDPFGRWIQFKNKRFDTMAEMCKPVIYLYPEEKTSMTVSVAPNGGIYNSEPAYNGGWNIEVFPNGKIKDLNTGKEYESLLWEGYGLHYPEIIAGWVVKQPDLNAFLGKKLAVLGLNEKEIADFKAYWIEKLSEKPYYEIAFLNKAQIDVLAPLGFSVEPDRVIRVIMTAKGLDKPILIPEQVLPKTPQRAGFTIVEWGGALLK